MDSYEAASCRGELVVAVDEDEVPLRVQLSPAAMHLPAEELASRIVRLNSLARLRCQSDGDQCSRRSAAQVAAYAQTIDF